MLIIKVKFQILALFLYLLSNFLHTSEYHYIYPSKSNSKNSFGSVGLIQVPSAKNDESGNLTFTYTNTGFYNFGALTVSPFDWLEASYFYYRPSDIWWYGPGSNYLDKGFSFKVSKFLNQIQHHVAIGLEDFAGTGWFSREYVMLTKSHPKYEISYGLGWGAYSEESSFKNPFDYIDDRFSSRDTERAEYGGSLSFNSYFRGRASLVGGIEFFIPHKRLSSFFVEFDPFDYQFGFSTNGTLFGQDLNKRSKDSNINFGFKIDLIENIDIKLSYIKGNSLNVSFSFGGSFAKPFFKKNLPNPQVIDSKKGNTPIESFYEDLIANINRQSIFLQSAELADGNLKVAVSSSKYRNPIHVHAVLGQTVAEIQKPASIVVDTMTTVGVNVGHELHQITSPLKDFNERKNSILELVAKEIDLAAGDGDAYRFYEFRPTINYPASFTGIAPALVNHIGDPAKFYYGGIILRLDNEIQFSSRIQLNTEIHQNIANNFDEKRNFPDSLLPNVRTDIVSYLQESDTYISRMQLDYFFNPYKEIFGKFSFGILENMYAGVGVEFLYKPFEQNFSFGLEAYRAKKRAFDRSFNLLDYEINTGHINFNYHLPQWGILGTLSYGKYLAGDEGYTFDISRRLSSGFRTGIFFTRTNVTAEQFGEGSFDKGFYFQIPIDLFLNDYRGGYINFKLRPLTRDGGQKLEAGNDLIGIMHSTSRAEIERDWSSFND